jgi:hypothetical protein
MMNYVVDEWVAESHGTIHLMQLLVYLFLSFILLSLFEMRGLLEQSVKLNTNCLSCLL